MEQLASNGLFIYILLGIIGGLFTILAFLFKSFINKLNKLDPERFNKMADMLEEVWEDVLGQKYINQGIDKDIVKLKDDVKTLHSKNEIIESKITTINSKLNIPQ